MKNVTVCIMLVLVMLVGSVSAEVVKWIPVAASNAGQNGTQWTTEMWILSRVVDGPIEVHIAFLPEAEGTTVPDEITVEIPATRSIHIEDVVGTLFGESRPGALRLRSEFTFEVQSRTYSTGDGGGTFGQGIPAVMAERRDFGWALLGAANRVGDDGVRCNLGLFNMRDEDEDVSVYLIDQTTGDWIGDSGEIHLGGYGWVQINVFDLVGESDMEVDNAIVKVYGAPTIRGYLSKIDNRSGDGTFILPVASRPAYSIPVEWKVSLNLEYESGVTMDTLVYTGEDGEDVTVTAPENRFRTTLYFMSPGEFCYEVNCTCDSGSGSTTVKVSTIRGVDSGHHGLSTRTRELGGEGARSIEHCIDLY